MKPEDYRIQKISLYFTQFFKIHSNAVLPSMPIIWTDFQALNY
jgi:hypothetical protein